MVMISLYLLVSGQVRPSSIWLHGILFMDVLFIQTYYNVITNYMWMNINTISRQTHFRK